MTTRSHSPICGRARSSPPPRTKLDRNTAVIVFGDHGEAWGEHKRYFHGQDLTEEQLRVPSWSSCPGKNPW